MSKKDKGTVQETEAERALAQNALQRLADYKQRWQPVQRRLAQDVREMGAEGSVERERMAGKAVSDTRGAFAQGAQAAEAAQRSAGVDPGSSKFKLGVTQQATDEARSTGMGIMAADQAIDDAYVRGLSSLMSIGRGTQAAATDNLSSLAGLQAGRAQDEATRSATNRAGNYQLAGQAAGIAIGAGMPGRAQAPNPATTSRAPSAVGINADPFSGY